MRVLHVIHGYPMRFNAGSEVYTQSLAQAQAGRHEVRVFTRSENSFAPEGALLLEHDPDDPRIRLDVVNVPNSRDCYRRATVDDSFARVLDDFRPDVVHVGHLNHLSTSLVHEARRRDLPIVFTLHDYWLMCPRGQFMQMHPEEPADLWPRCDGQRDGRCAERCYARYFSGAPDEREADVAYWTDWVKRRMAHVRAVVAEVDLFIAPSRFLLERHRDEFGLPASRMVYLDYGLHIDRLGGRHRVSERDFVFGYIGTHIPAKGIHVLLDAFARVPGKPRLRIWGRPRGADTDSLKVTADALPGDAAARVEWLAEYRNADIVDDVFNHVDAIIVPSIWDENSPLVIHEAQQARIPVITADVGGMAEYVVSGVNGLLFRHRDPDDLAQAMSKVVDDPDLAGRLGRRGYLFSESGDVPDMRDHVRDIEDLYARVIRERRSVRPARRGGPWRITFDTSPDDCNLHCIMCEEHSEHSDKQTVRRAAGLPRRRMPFDLAARVVREQRGTPLREIIPSTMGEPLLYPDFERLIDLCAQEGLLLNLTTNGTFPRLGAHEWARRLVPVLSDVKVSWNGATASTQEAIMRGSHFVRMLDNLRTLVAERDRFARSFGHRATITLQPTFLEANVHELADLVRLAAREGVDRVKGHHVWTHFAALEGLSLRRSPEVIAKWNTAVRAARIVANGEQVRLVNFHELLDGDASDIAPGAPCPFLDREAWINTEGRFDPCCAPDDLRRSLGSFGRVGEVPFAAIWEGTEYRRLVATHAQNPLCRACNMRQPLEGA